MTFKVLHFISFRYSVYRFSCRCFKLRVRRYSGWVLGDVEKKAEETVSEQLSVIDRRISGWTITALGDDDSLEEFLRPSLASSISELGNNLQRNFPETHLYVLVRVGSVYRPHSVLQYGHRISQISSGHHLQGYLEYDTLFSCLQAVPVLCSALRY